MMNTENTNKNTNEATVNTQEQQMQLVENNQPEQEQKPEKKKIGVKGWAKRIGIGAAAIGGLALAAFGGFEAGKHSQKSTSGQTDAPAPVDNNTSIGDAEI